MRSHAALVVLLSVLAVSAGAAQQPLTASAQPTVQSAAQVAADGPARDTKLTIQLASDGDARWNVSMWFELDNENETAAFERLASDFEAGKAETKFNADMFQTIADTAESETGREMRIRNVERSTAVTNDTGRLTLAFTWTSFAAVDGERVMLGDVFRTESGTWLSSLSADQQLVIKAPPNYGVNTSPENIGVSNAKINITGPRTFEPGELSVTYTRGYRPLFGALNRLFGGVSWVSASGVVVLLTVMVASIYVWRRRRQPIPLGPLGGRSDDAAADAVESPPDDPPAESPPATAESETPDDDGVDESLLSDEERVERLLEANDGRMMQANIVSETNWSNAKVSQLLSAMAEDGRIDKLRIGRENLITLPDEDVGDIE